jgi:hypothetical protein
LILLIFAKSEHLLRKAAARSKEAVWRKIGALRDQFSPVDCENHLPSLGDGSV